GRARVRASLLYSLDDEALHLLDALGRGEHLQRSHVVAACPLAEQRQPEPVAGHDIVVDDRRSVVAGVGPVHRTSDDGFAQVTLVVAAAGTLAYRFADPASHYTRLASEFDEEDSV